MQKKEFTLKLQSTLTFDLTSDQMGLIEALFNFIFNDKNVNIFIIKGYAGTGKTTIIGAFIQTLRAFGISTSQMAPTGRAAKVLHDHTGLQVNTIHKSIYQQRNVGTIDYQFNKRAFSDEFQTYFIDEASMISGQSFKDAIFGSGNILEDLITTTLTSENNKLIFIGDDAQLPPIGQEHAPALDKKHLEQFGFEVSTYRLTEVVRHQKQSGILHNATKIRDIITDTTCWDKQLKFDIQEFEDLNKSNGRDVIEEIETCYDKQGRSETILITRSNKRATIFNQGIRNSIFFYEEKIETGDLIMVVKNNYFWSKEYKEIDFIANGEIAEVTRVGRTENVYGVNFVDLELRLLESEQEISCKAFLDLLHSDQGNINYAKTKELYFNILEEHRELATQREQWKHIRECPYFNALQIKFSYAITCHKAQGGQWKNVFIDQGYITEEHLDSNFLKWLYSAITRAKDKAFLLNFNKEFFHEKDQEIF
ncbi:AAA family ATPase [Halosquirtibacter xylanolyticus]|uniref:ATP-dependent DNA helicase n=1 Tax=Halosquirtibacter xylanolyticus TaxID=3374599 RepID=UPI0037498E76|nr:AAA family ATPase [Prolixibacteraceae bacterium]